MTEIWAQAALWLGLALIATLLSIWLRIATALSEIVVGTIAQLLIGALIGAAVLGTGETWVKFLSGTGAILLTFLAGAELDPDVFRAKWKEAGAIGLISFAACFVTDLGTVLALGLIFSPFTYKTLIFIGVSAVAFVILPWLTPRFFRHYGNRPSDLETKYLLLLLFGLGAF